CQIYISSPLTF
nr:immunoglobulin light chain junction region [Macaca mulatta]MOW08164.1 immunoglobulin light chain junction region [Macaca mulatta]MOW08324.1 immunoglobulin light chain junction region [Macaca mulatta]MOW08705.1 immunoglobulin light chain junction region [Macaca mulatta]MOW08985.1 immunoglobulin light chain junction region [Macaca mulatta]